MTPPIVPAAPPTSPPTPAPGGSSAGASRADPDPLLAFLASRNVGCPACEYNLRDLHSHICPECGVTLSLNTILAADPDFPHRRRALIRACILLAITGLAAPAIAPLIAAAFARPTSSPLVFLPPLGVLISGVVTVVALIWDNAIYNDRIRFPRARHIPSFRPVVRALTIALYLELALDVIICVLAVVP